jgi:nucleoside-triphosphatase
LSAVKNILLTGRPGSGKTTALRSAIDMIQADAGGFYTQEIREKGVRTGFEIITLGGEKRAMASKGLQSQYHVGRYGVDVDAVDMLATGAILDAISHKNIVVIDEIGRMELFSGPFRSAVLRALDSPKVVLGVIMEKPDPYADSVKARKDVELVRVTEKNRDEIPVLLKTKAERLLR